MKGRDILVAFDGSEYARRAVDYVGSHFLLKDATITLFYVLPGVPPHFWADDHILSPAEHELRKEVVEKWLSNQKEILRPLFEKARRMLEGKGADPARIETIVRTDVGGVAEAVIEEARTGRYRTLVLGRHGVGHKGQVFTGKIVTAVLHEIRGLTICVVE